jgi:hypothetical protein
MTADERLDLVREIYDFVGRSAKIGYARQYARRKFLMGRHRVENPNRENPLAWDMYRIMAAIAGDYRIELSPHYRGVQRIRRNKGLWKKVSQFVVLKVGQGCLPHDPGC